MLNYYGYKDLDHTKLIEQILYFMVYQFFDLFLYKYLLVYLFLTYLRL